jgi:uncharacterized phiE125 gp8 family phage protein
MISRHIEVVTAPAYEPVSLAEAKAWMRVDHDDEDDVISLLVKAMRERAENITGRAFVKRTLRLHLSDYTYHERMGLWVELPRAPLISVDSFKYTDDDGVEQTLATDQYVVHTEREPGFIVPAWDEFWPSIRRVPYPIRVTYQAGYAPVGSPEDEAAHQEPLPAALKVWMEANAATLYDQRSQLIIGTIVAQLPRTFSDGLLDDLVIAGRLF